MILAGVPEGWARRGSALAAPPLPNAKAARARPLFIVGASWRALGRGASRSERSSLAHSLFAYSRVRLTLQAWAGAILLCVALAALSLGGTRLARLWPPHALSKPGPVGPAKVPSPPVEAAALASGPTPPLARQAGEGLSAVGAPRASVHPPVFDVKAIAQILAGPGPESGSPRRRRKNRAIEHVLATLNTPALEYDFEVPAAAPPRAAAPRDDDLLPLPGGTKAPPAPLSLPGGAATLQVDPDMPANKLPFASGPGQLSPAAGAGQWNGAPAAAMGLGYTLPDGKMRLDAAGVTNVNGVPALPALPKSFGLSAVATVPLP